MTAERLRAGASALRPGRPPVVLLGGLNIVRALGLAGIPVIIASRERDTPSMASRYCAGSLALPAEGDAEAVQVLVAAGRWLAARCGARPPLFYDNDDRLRLVHRNRDLLEPHFALAMNEPCLEEAFLDKALFQSLAERRGLPVPRRIEWRELAAERGPVLVKPSLRIAWQHHSVLHRLLGGVGKARVFDDGAAAAAHPEARQLAEQLVFQEYIPGGDEANWSFHGFAAPGGEVLAWFVGCKIRTFPPETGDSAYVRVERNEELVAIGRGIAAELQLGGFFKMDFKRHARAGSYHLLEVNPRVNLWHYVGAKSGVNLPEAAYEYLVRGRRPPPPEARPGLRWLSLPLDWAAFRQLNARGELSAWRWLWSLIEARKVCDLFSWRDPLPFARYWATRLRAALARRVHRWLATAS